MPSIERQPKDRESRKKIARVVKQRLAILIAFLIAILLALMLRVGASLWPVWMIARRTQIQAIIILAIIILLLVSPLIVEASRNPRSLSGPGKNPEGPRLE
jgi:hypothetical protein